MKTVLNKQKLIEGVTCYDLNPLHRTYGTWVVHFVYLFMLNLLNPRP